MEILEIFKLKPEISCRRGPVENSRKPVTLELASLVVHPQSCKDQLECPHCYYTIQVQVSARHPLSIPFNGCIKGE